MCFPSAGNDDDHDDIGDDHDDDVDRSRFRIFSFVSKLNDVGNGLNSE